jgi:hypothetical protein
VNKQPGAVTVIVPFSRPEYALRTLQNFERQLYPDKRLWIVENGPAIGTWARLSLPADRVLTSRAHQSHARNVGLNELRSTGGGYWAGFDDDDWYGAEYLTEIAAQADKANVVGKRQHFIGIDDRYLFLFLDHLQSRYTIALTGGALAAWSEESVDFPIQRVAEDIGWCSLMRRAGARIYNTSAYHYLYRRCTDGHHTSGAQSIDRLIYQHGRGNYLGLLSHRVVSGEREPELRVPVQPYQHFDPASIESVAVTHANL